MNKMIMFAFLGRALDDLCNIKIEHLKEQKDGRGQWKCAVWDDLNTGTVVEMYDNDYSAAIYNALVEFETLKQIQLTEIYIKSKK